MVECITHTIVINHGSEDNAYDLKMEQIQSLHDQGLDASRSIKQTIITLNMYICFKQLRE
jgi:hypothetical protein